MEWEDNGEAEGVPVLYFALLGHAAEGDNKSPWAERLTLLMGARGWSKTQLGRELGIGLAAVNGMLTGRRQKHLVNLILRLKGLEELYAEDLARYQEHLAAGHTRRSFRVRAIPPGGVRRPQDIETLGAVGAADASAEGGHGALATGPRKLVDWTDAGRREFKKNRYWLTRRPKIVRFRPEPGDAGGGTWAYLMGGIPGGQVSPVRYLEGGDGR